MKNILAIGIFAACLGIGQAAYAQCASDADCNPGDFCDITTALCVGDGTIILGGDCWQDEDCLPGDLCDGGVCVAGPTCTSDADCGGDDVCDVGTGQCLANPVDGTVVVGGYCVSDADCESGACGSDGLCLDGGSSGCSAARAATGSSTGLLGLGFLAAALGLVLRRRS